MAFTNSLNHGFDTRNW